jgi:hypothetical protein
MNNEEFMKLMYQEITTLRKDVTEIKSEMSTLKVKVAFFSSIVGGVVSFLANKLF